jgi:hypothetical protein
MNKSSLIVLAAAFVSALMLLPREAAAQEKQKVKLDVSAAQTKYTYQHVLDVGDLPGHQVRMYEIQRTFKDTGPVYRGVRAVEEQIRGQSDMTNGNGQSWGYTITVLENGDKIFSRYVGTIWTVEGEGGTKQTTYNGTGTYVGGTGAFKAIRGTNRSRSVIQLKDGQVQSNQQDGEGEYWFEK